MHRSWLMIGLVILVLTGWQGIAAGTVGDEEAESSAEIAADGAQTPTSQATDPASLARQFISRMTPDDADHGDEPAAARQIALFRLEGEIPEVANELSLLGGKRVSTLEKWLRKIAQARNDASVSTIVLELGDVEVGWAQVAELRGAIRRVRDTGKPIHAYLSDGNLKNYAIACACDEVVIAPAGHLIIPGLHLQMWFYKNLLDKLGVTADILHIGPYKGAGEPYTRNAPSPELQEQYTNLTDDLYQQILGQIAESRGLSEQEAAAAIDTALFSAEQAMEAKLVDRVASLDDLLTDLKDQQQATVNDKYGRRGRQEPDFSNSFAFFQMFSRVGKRFDADKPAIGLLLVDGMIVDRKDGGLFESGMIEPDDIKEAVEEALADDKIKAVVMRIDSPGGSGLASDIMYGHIRRLAAKKPVVVSMGNVAASGGYYIAAASPVIMAEPATITGSIGVLGGKIVLGGLFEKIGITTWSVSRGRIAGVFDGTAAFTPAERQKVLDLMNDIYATFLSRVLDTRGDKLSKPIDEIAGGRVYTGRQALELGLVDKLGGLTEAVYLAAEQAGVKNYQIRMIPKPKSFFEVLFEDLLSGADAEVQALGIHAGAILPAGSDRTSASIRKVIHRALARIRLLQDQSVLTVLPFDTNLVP